MKSDVTVKDDAINCCALLLCPCKVSIPVFIGIETRGAGIQNALEIDSNPGFVGFITILEPQMQLGGIGLG